LDLAGELFSLGARMVGVQHNGIAFVRQRQRNRATDAARRTGDQRRPRQRFVVRHHASIMR
jgi:hypothetical protein